MSMATKVGPHGAVNTWSHGPAFEAWMLMAQEAVDAHVVQHGWSHLRAVLVQVPRLVMLQRVVFHARLRGQDGVAVGELDRRDVQPVPLASVVHVAKQVEVEVGHGVGVRGDL